MLVTKEFLLSRFMGWLRQNGEKAEDFTFVCFDVHTSENRPFIRNLLPFLRAKVIPFEFKNIDIIKNNTIPPIVKLSTLIDKNGDFRVEEIGYLGIVCVKESQKERIYVLYLDTPYSTHRFDSGSLCIIASRNMGSIKKMMIEVLCYTKDRERQNGDFILYNGISAKRRPKVSWEDIILIAEIKQDIRSNLNNFFKGRELYRKINLPYKRGFIFIGPPGNGKTMICKAIAHMYPNIPYIYCQPDGIASSNEIFEESFNTALRLAPSILCIEDLDVIMKDHLSKSFFLNLVDGLSENEGILFIATMNHPELLDQNIINRPSRFDRIWRIDPPDEELRFNMLKKLMNGNFNDETLMDFAGETDGFSMAYLKELFISSSIRALDEGRDYLTVDDIDHSLKTLRKQFVGGKNYYEKQGIAGFKVVRNV